MIPKPNRLRPIVQKDGTMERQFATIVSQLADLSIITGTGSPEGLVEAAQSRLYMDDAGTTGAILYIKRDVSVGGDSSLGWILV